MRAISIKTQHLLLLLFLVFTASAESPEKTEIRKTPNSNDISHFSASSAATTYRVIVFSDVGWTKKEVERITQEAAAIYARECNFALTSASVEFIRLEQDFYRLDKAMQEQLLAELSDVKRPIVFFINETVENDYAYAYIRGTVSPSQGTAWISRKTSKTCRGPLLAHELGHILLKQKQHSQLPGNLMRDSCRHSNVENHSVDTYLTAQQCQNLYNN